MPPESDAPKVATNPLDAARVTSPPQAKVKAAPVEAKVAAPPPPLAPPVKVAVYRVTSAPKRVSWGGQFLHLKPGDLVSAETHGPSAVARLREADVQFELVE